jgi:hypothetical protein
MNTILQKRIEEAATFLFKQRGLDKESCRQAMDYILSNQWISVEEALPEETEDGFCDDKFVLYCSEYPATASYDHKSKKWYYGDYEILGVTHWMPIPSLEGGKE